jgi:uncharacterized protein (DUF1778 family)
LSAHNATKKSNHTEFVLSAVTMMANKLLLSKKIKTNFRFKERQTPFFFLFTKNLQKKWQKGLIFTFYRFIIN